MIYAMNVPLLFNRSLLKLHRDRSVLYHFEIQDIFQQCTDRLLERLDDINRSFEFALEIGGRGYVSSYLKNRKIIRFFTFREKGYSRAEFSSSLLPLLFLSFFFPFFLLF